MNISEFAKQIGLSQHTLRYYEKIGLLPEIARNISNHRDYSERDVAWLDFIKWLKDTNMSLADILQYAILREQGEATEAERRQLLIKHAAQLEKTIQNNIEHLNKLKAKIQFYEKRLGKKESA